MSFLLSAEREVNNVVVITYTLRTRAHPEDGMGGDHGPIPGRGPQALGRRVYFAGVKRPGAAILEGALRGSSLAPIRD